MELPEHETMIEMINERLSDVGKSQKQLANMIGNSAGQISRDLSDDSDVSYRKIKEINDIILEWEEKRTKPASELMMDGEIEWADPEDTCGDAAEKMKTNLYSQLPVRDEDEVLGIVTDIDLIEHESDELIGDIDLQHLIQVEQDAPRELLKKILEHDHPAVLVVNDGSPVGLVTRFDLLNTS